MKAGAKLLLLSSLSACASARDHFCSIQQGRSIGGYVTREPVTGITQAFNNLTGAARQLEILSGSIQSQSILTGKIQKLENLKGVITSNKNLKGDIQCQ